MTRFAPFPLNLSIVPITSLAKKLGTAFTDGGELK